MFAIVVTIASLGLFAFMGAGARSLEVIYRQLFFISLGGVVMVGVALADYRIFKNYSSASISLYIVTILLLVFVLASAKIRGIHGWIALFDHYQFQPSEFAKLVVALLLAKYFSQKHSSIYQFSHVLASGFYVGIPALLTFLQPDFGSMVVFLGLWLVTLFFSGIRKKHLGILLGIAAIAAVGAWFFVFKQYQKNRIISFINPYVDARGIGYNTLQAQATVGSGKLLGSFYQSAKEDRKLAVLVPEAFTDFAFAAYAQKFGFVGVLALLSLFGLLFWRIGTIVTRVGSNFAMLFGLGLIVIMGIHLLINIGMNLGVLPITGIPLSFLSYGGSHFMTMMIGIGIIQSMWVRS